MKNTPADRSVEGPLALARLAEQRGKTIEAERLFRSILEKSPQNRTAIHRLAVIEAKKGRFQEAEKYFDQALTFDPDNAEILCDAGYCQFLQHRLGQAEALYRRALEVDSANESATNNLAMLLGEKGDDRAALALFRQMGTEAKAQTNMGFVYSRRGEIAKAKAAYSQALTLDPKSMVAAEALVQLAQFEKHAESGVAQSGEPVQAASTSVVDLDLHAGPVVEDWPSMSSQATSPQPFERQRASSGQTLAPALASRATIQQSAPTTAATTAEFVSAGKLDPAVPAIAYPAASQVKPSSAGEAQASGVPQPRAAANSTQAAIKAMAEGFNY